MNRFLIFMPIYYTQQDVLNKVFNVLHQEYGNFYPVFLDPTNCQYNGNEIRINKLEKEIKDQIICFANFTRTLKEHNLWWDKNTQKWNIYFWCNDDTIKHVSQMTTKNIGVSTNIEKLYLDGSLNQKGYLGDNYAK